MRLVGGWFVLVWLVVERDVLYDYDGIDDVWLGKCIAD